MLNENFEILIIHITALEALLLQLFIYLDKKTQIASLFFEKFTILNKYFDFANVFLKKKTLVLLEQIKLNKYIIKLENNKKLSYKPIYNLGLTELEILKIYITIYLKTEFI